MTQFETDEILKRIFALRDPDYQAFQAKLIPTIDPALVIGVRTPQLRSLAKELAGTSAAEAFLASLPHRYYEENNLHAFLIERTRDFDGAIAATDEFLPFVNNWATCDSMSPKAFVKRPDALLEKIDEWMASDAAFTARFGIGMLMRHFLDERFRQEFLEEVAHVPAGGWKEAPGTLLASQAGQTAGSRNRSERKLTESQQRTAGNASEVKPEKARGESITPPCAHRSSAKAQSERNEMPNASYYVNMMRAWFFATALTKQPEATLPFMEERRLDPWTHDKAIQKAIESRRVSAEMKVRLRTLKTPRA